jgi:hypothetical protein
MALPGAITLNKPIVDLAVTSEGDEMTAAGYVGRQPPFDAFWGARYAIVADPDGNDVGLMSPIDESRRHWPPVESPSPYGRCPERRAVRRAAIGHG